jgi:hypothetical protein
MVVSVKLPYMTQVNNFTEINIRYDYRKHIKEVAKMVKLHSMSQKLLLIV